MFSEIEDKLEVYDDNTYDPLKNGIYSELLIAIEDAAVVDL